jgi:Lon protease-like protein
MSGFTERYRTPSDLPEIIPVFPLSGALLLPRTDLPLNIFEPRYLAMIDDCLSGHRIVGMVQPLAGLPDSEKPGIERVGCAGRITSYAETPDGRMLITLTGIMRFMIAEELEAATDYRQVRPDYEPFAVDLMSDFGAADVNRPALLQAFRDYLDVNDMRADWDQIDAASTEVLVNTLSLLAPYPARDKQALLEAPDLRTRAEVLVALTEVAIARSSGSNGRRLQ